MGLHGPRIGMRPRWNTGGRGMRHRDDGGAGDDCGVQGYTLRRQPA